MISVIRYNGNFPQAYQAVVGSDQGQIKHFCGSCKEVIGGVAMESLSMTVASATSTVRGASSVGNPPSSS